MPYRTRAGKLEMARSTGHSAIVESELVKERLASFRIFTPSEPPDLDASLIVAGDSLAAPGAPARWAMSFDGSPQEVAVREEYPSTRVGYIQVAGVLVHLEKLLGEQRAHLVDPAVVHEASEEALYCMVLPGSNVCRGDMPSVRESWRAEVFDIFQTYRVEDVPFIDVFRRLIGFSDKQAGDGVLLARCSASDDCGARDITVSYAGSDCPQCHARLFPTDVLRLHEEILEEHPNATALGRLMTVLEHVTLVGYLDFLSNRQLRVLPSVAFIMDGPLALFGPQAWLHRAILAFIHNLQSTLRQEGLRPPTIVGIEKTGQFAEHGAAIQNRLPRRALMRLSDDYIFQHILVTRPPAGSTYGRDTYYGQKFFYRTSQGQFLTISIPKCEQGNGHPDDPHQYACLPDTLALLDRIGTSLYTDAVIPVALAHSYASIPLRTGSRVLTLLSRELLGAQGV